MVVADMRAPIEYKYIVHRCCRGTTFLLLTRPHVNDEHTSWAKQATHMFPLVILFSHLFRLKDLGMELDFWALGTF